MKAKWIFAIIVVIAGLLGLGVLLILIASSLYNNWWPIAPMMSFLMAPFPYILCGVSQNTLFDDEETGELANFITFFFTGIFIVSALAPLLIMLRVQVINLTAFYLSMSGGTMIWIAILLSIKLVSVSHSYEGIHKF